MKFRVVYILLILLSILGLCFNTREKRKNTVVKFSYTINYKGDTISNKLTGLKWALSYLGATLPKGSFSKGIKNLTPETFDLDIDSLGFNETAKKSILIITDSLQNTKEGKKGIDPGLFVSLTVGSSWHYYKITGAPKSCKSVLDDFKQNEYKAFPVTNSTITKHNRLIKYSAISTPDNWTFVAIEGNGSIADGTFSETTYEILNIMPNGQIRFAIYNKKGELIPASPKGHGSAGKPAKCLWCHEIVVNPLFGINTAVKGFQTPQQFNEDVKEINKRLSQYRQTLNSDLDFTKTQEHTQMELLYISYMQPSRERLAAEWKISPYEVQKLTAKLEAVDHEEFKFLGKLINRKDVLMEKGLIPGSIREQTKAEPDFFRKK